MIFQSKGIMMLTLELECDKLNMQILGYFCDCNHLQRLPHPSDFTLTDCTTKAVFAYQALLHLEW